MRSEGLRLALAAMNDGAGGGTAALARGLGVRSQAISQWREVPANRVLRVEQLSGVARWRLRPDLYPPPDGDHATKERAEAAIRNARSTASAANRAAQS